MLRLRLAIAAVMMMIAGLTFAAPAEAATVWHERHCKDSSVGIFENNVIRMCLGVYHTLQGDGDGIKILQENMNIIEGCQFLHPDGAKADPAAYTVDTGPVTYQVNLGPLNNCSNTRFRVLNGPDSGPMDVRVSVRYLVNADNPEWVNFAFRLQRENDV